MGVCRCETNHQSCDWHFGSFGGNYVFVLWADAHWTRRPGRKISGRRRRKQGHRFGRSDSSTARKMGIGQAISCAVRYMVGECLQRGFRHFLFYRKTGAARVAEQNRSYRDFVGGIYFCPFHWVCFAPYTKTES